MDRYVFTNNWVRLESGEVDQSPEEIELGGPFYKLVGRRAIVCDVLEWGEMFKDISNRVVGKEHVNGSEVSTVFLGLDHSFGYGPPLLFETMIFGGVHNGDTWRCSTYAQAERQHQEALALAEV